MKLTSLALFGLASSARIRRHHQTNEVDLEMFTMSQAVSAAGGFLNISDGPLMADKCDAMWSKELDKEFKDKKAVGAGATACVFLAHDETDTLVAVKVGKGGKDQQKRLASWEAECRDMQDLRMAACQAGPGILALHEQYLPTCTKVRPTHDGAYYVMHAAGTTGMRDVPKHSYTTKDKKSMFAAFVTSVYALHAVDQTHNDLHGQNIVLDGTQLALIDFGSLKTLQRSWRKDYKRDSNAIWRWGAMLGDCNKNALWTKQQQHSEKAAEEFLSCMKKFSDNEPTFMAALKDLVDGDIHESNEHHVKELYASKWVQDNKPAPKTYYPWVGTGSCLSWSKDDWGTYEVEHKYPGFHKCDEIATYKKLENKCDKHGKVYDTACYSNTPGERWKCGGCSKGLITHGFDGGCLFPSSPSYRFAK